MKVNQATLAVSVMATKDKVGRANQCTMPLSAGRVFIPDPNMPDYAWVEGFIAEHESFTTDDSHLYDDQVDTFTEACLIWQSRGGGSGAIPVLN
jgi:predicted phage terminase large subunit-like protein